jgi:hypothetical protein
MAEKDVEGKGDSGKTAKVTAVALKDVEGKGDDGKDVEGKGGTEAQGDLVSGIVNRATALGGWLLVSIVSPLPPNGRRFGSSDSGPSTAMRQVAEILGKRVSNSAGKIVSEPAVQRGSYREPKQGTAKTKRGTKK